MRKLLRSQSGTSAVEFALIAPVLLGLIMAIMQVGQLYFANVGLKSAVAEGARYASLFQVPKPTNAQIAAKITASQFGLVSNRITGPTVTDCTDTITVGTRTTTRRCVDISMSYQVPFDLIFFRWGTFNLTASRRAFIY